MSANALRFEPMSLYIVCNPFQPKLDRLRPEEFIPNPYHNEPVTRLEVLVISPTGYITGLWTNSGDTELKSFKDDTGFDLLENGGGDSGSEVSPDFSTGNFHITGRSAPAAAATKLHAQGDILISTASGITPVKSAPFELKVGTEIDVAGFLFRISSVESRDDANGQVEVIFKRSSNQSKLRDVARIYFEDSNGETLDYDPSYSKAHGIDEEYELEDEYVFRTGKVKPVLVVECWEDRFEWIEDYNIVASLTCRLA